MSFLSVDMVLGVIAGAGCSYLFLRMKYSRQEKQLSRAQKQIEMLMSKEHQINQVGVFFAELLTRLPERPVNDKDAAA